MTLIELLIAMIILGIMVSAVVTTIILVVKTTDETNNRLAESHDAQLAASYYVTDVQSADTVKTSFPSGTVLVWDGADPNRCGAPVTGATSVMQFDWSDPAGSARTAFYYLLDATEGTIVTERRLIRLYCEKNDSGVNTLAVDSTIAHFLKSAPVICISSPDARCITQGTATSPVVHLVACTLESRASAPGVGACRAGENEYTYELKGSRRSA